MQTDSTVECAAPAAVRHTPTPSAPRGEEHPALLKPPAMILCRGCRRRIALPPFREGTLVVCRVCRSTHRIGEEPESTPGRDRFQKDLVSAVRLVLGGSSVALLATAVMMSLETGSWLIGLAGTLPLLALLWWSAERIVQRLRHNGLRLGYLILIGGAVLSGFTVLGAWMQQAELLSIAAYFTFPLLLMLGGLCSVLFSQLELRERVHL